MQLNIQPFDYPIIVHCHLGWDWVWQRPQQFLSRFSQRHQILFVEGPVPSEEVSVPQVEMREVSEFPNITVLRMKMPASRWRTARGLIKNAAVSCRKSCPVRSDFASTTPSNGFMTQWR